MSRHHVPNCGPDGKGPRFQPFSIPASFTSAPNTTKDTEHYSSETLTVAVTSMQGWRDEMEDAYCVLLPKESAIDRRDGDLRRWRDAQGQSVKAACGLDEGVVGRQRTNSSSSMNSSATVGSLPGTPNVGALSTPPMAAASTITGAADDDVDALVFSSKGHGSVRIAHSSDGNARGGVSTKPLVVKHHRTDVISAANSPSSNAVSTAADGGGSPDAVINRQPSGTNGNGGGGLDVSPTITRTKSALEIAAAEVAEHHAPPSTKTVSLFGVFDGHGGPAVSEVVSRRMTQWVTNNPNFVKGHYEKALFESFVNNDANVHDEIMFGVEKDGKTVRRGPNGKRTPPPAPLFQMEPYGARREMWHKGGSTACVVMVVEDRSTRVTKALADVRRRAGSLTTQSAANTPSAATRTSQTFPTPPLGGIAGDNVEGGSPLLLGTNCSSSTYLNASGGGLTQNKNSSNNVNMITAPPNTGSQLLSAAVGGAPPPAESHHVDEVKIICANAGDSRAILVRSNGLFVPLSHDHCPTHPVEKERIVAAKGTVELSKGGGGRIDGILAVCRGFGDYDFKSDKKLPQDKQQVVVTPDVRTTFMKMDAPGRCNYPFIHAQALTPAKSDAVIGAGGPNYPLFTEVDVLVANKASQRAIDQGYGDQPISTTNRSRSNSNSSYGSSAATTPRRGSGSNSRDASPHLSRGMAMPAPELLKLRRTILWRDGQYDRTGVALHEGSSVSPKRSNSNRSTSAPPISSSAAAAALAEQRKMSHSQQSVAEFEHAVRMNRSGGGSASAATIIPAAMAADADSAAQPSSPSLFAPPPINVDDHSLDHKHESSINRGNGATNAFGSGDCLPPHLGEGSHNFANTCDANVPSTAGRGIGRVSTQSGFGPALLASTVPPNLTGEEAADVRNVLMMGDAEKHTTTEEEGDSCTEAEHSDDDTQKRGSFKMSRLKAMRRKARAATQQQKSSSSKAPPSANTTPMIDVPAMATVLTIPLNPTDDRRDCHYANGLPPPLVVGSASGGTSPTNAPPADGASSITSPPPLPLLPPLYYPSRVHAPMCVVLACDGIWDCMSSVQAADEVTRLIDKQLDNIVASLQEAKFLPSFSCGGISGGAMLSSDDDGFFNPVDADFRDEDGNPLRVHLERFSVEGTRVLARCLYTRIIPRICASCISEALVDRSFKMSLHDPCGLYHPTSPADPAAARAAAGGVFSPLPSKPNTVGTDNMTCMVVLFKEGIAARAMARYGYVGDGDAGLERVGGITTRSSSRSAVKSVAKSPTGKSPTKVGSAVFSGEM